jgi:glycosyltransferase involved in cell wall biosynthesis
MKISVAIVVKNESGYIKNCLEALFGQSYQDFEIIVVDNGSTDGTGEIISSLGDKRVKYFYDPSKCGIAVLRNISVKKATGEYIFFTDADCAPSKHWLEEGLRVLESGGCVGVEGKACYDSQGKIAISDSNVNQLIAGQFMTCNIAYTQDILKRVDYFDPLFKFGHEDRDLAFRVLKFGKINFVQDMLVFHQKKRLGVKNLFNRAKRAENLVYFVKKHGIGAADSYKNILYPNHLRTILCPPLRILGCSYYTLYDLMFGFLEYVSFIYERALIWKAARKNRVFVI